jgi:hypothetical protein
MRHCLTYLSCLMYNVFVITKLLEFQIGF